MNEGWFAVIGVTVGAIATGGFSLVSVIMAERRANRERKGRAIQELVEQLQALIDEMWILAIDANAIASGLRSPVSGGSSLQVVQDQRPDMMDRLNADITRFNVAAPRLRQLAHRLPDEDLAISLLRFSEETAAAMHRLPSSKDIDKIRQQNMDRFTELSGQLGAIWREWL